MTTLIIHIGVHKTGSTAIQHALASQTARLAQAAILYPVAGRPEIESIRHGQHALAWAALGRDDADSSVYDALAAEMSDSGASTVVVSTEEFNRFRAAEIARLREVIAPLCRRVRVVAYLRRQSDVVQGLFGTDIVYNRVALPIDAYAASFEPRLDYEAVEADWAKIADDAEVVLRPYDSDVRAGGGLLTDFLGAAGLPRDAFAGVRRERRNVSLPWHAALSVQHLWRLGLPELLVFDTIETLKVLLSEEQGGSYAFWPPSRAAGFDAAFAEANSRLAARHPHLSAVLAPAGATDDADWNATRDRAWAAIETTLAAINRGVRERRDVPGASGG